MEKFTQLPSFSRLEALARDPIDFGKEELLVPQRVERFSARSAGWHLLYPTERVTQHVVQALEQLAVEADAVEKMRQMQQGSVVNTTERRPALHTATRAIFEPCWEGTPAADAAQFAKEEISKLSAFLKEITFEVLIVIGIGGSDLGPRAHYCALEGLFPDRREVHFISNVDPDDLIGVVRRVSLAKTLVAVISKSGTTLETSVNEAFMRQQFEKEGLDPANHLIAVTTPNSPMSERQGYRRIFYFLESVGGRYSTTSLVGGIVLSFAFGIEAYLEFLRGAFEMDQAALETNLNDNIPLLTALLAIWNHNFLAAPTYAVIPYAQGLHRYVAHLQQLEMESNGKGVTARGATLPFQTSPILWGEPGTNAQHSFFQMLHQGTQPVPLLLIGFARSQCNVDLLYDGTSSQEKLLSNLIAQSMTLAMGYPSDHPEKRCPGNRPNSILFADRLTPLRLGALLSLFEHRTAFQGFMWGINSFDQEGVQLGKTMAGNVSRLFAQQRTGSLLPEKDPLSYAYLRSLGLCATP